MTVRFPSVLILATATVIGCSDPAKSRQEYVTKANALLETAHYREAVIEYRNALKVDGRFGPARLGLARALEKSGNLSAAKGEYVRAADLLPGDASVQLDAARVLLATGDYENARARADLALKLDPKNATAHLLRGRAAAGMDGFDEALKAFEEGITADGDRSDLYINAGQLRAIRGESAEAEASFKQAVAVAPESVDAHLSLADYYWYTGRLPDAERTLVEAVKLQKDGSKANHLLAMFYIRNGRAKEAEVPLKLAAEADKRPQLRLILAEYYASDGRVDEALAILGHLAGQPNTRAFATVRIAEIEFARGRKNQAYHALDELIAAEPKNTLALVTRSEFFLADSKPDKALAAGENAVQSDPAAWIGPQALGLAQVRLRRWNDADKSLREALRLSPRAFRSDLGLVEVSLAHGKADEALRHAESAARLQPSNEAVRYALARAYLASGDVVRARASVAGLPDSAQVQSLRGRIELRAKNVDGARRAFEAAAALDPKSTDALSGLVAIDASQKQIGRAVARVEQHLSSNPTSAASYHLAAQTYLAADRMAEAEAAARKAIALDPSLLAAYNILGSLYRQQGKLDDAQKMYDRLSTERPNDVPAQTMAGTIRLLQGDMSGARERFEKVLAVDSRAAIASNNLAYMDAEAGANLDIALNRAQTAKAALPDDPGVDDTLGWVYVKRGLPALAFTPLEQAVRKDPRNPVYAYHLGTAHAKNGDHDRAREMLQAALKLSPSFPGADDAKRTLQSLGN